MSRVIGKEIESKVILNQVKPTIPSLIDYLKAEDIYTPIYVKQIDKVEGVDIIHISNGTSFYVNADNRWEMC